MVQWHIKSDTKISGGYRNSINRCNKKLAWRGGEISNTAIAPKEKIKSIKARGHKRKPKLEKTKFAYIHDKGSNKAVKGELITVKINNADRQFARQNILTKGAIFKVKVGTAEKWAKVTNRPGQTGTVQAIFVEEPKAA